MIQPRLILLLTFLSLSQLVLAQETKSYYVTIGVFAKLDNAERLVKKATGQGYEANYSVGPIKELKYVYVLSTTEKRKAYALAIKLRAETEYKDAWVYDGEFTETSTKPEAKDIEQEPTVVVAPIIIETVPAIDSSKIITPPIEVPPVVEVKIKPVGKPFYFKLINTVDGNEIKIGDIQVQEAIGATQYQQFKAGEIVYLAPPKNKRGSFTVVTQVPGYKSQSTLVDYQAPVGEKGSQDEVIIELPMAKAKKGDYVDFNNVKFFKNSSILQAVSQNELDGLVDLLKEDMKYKIKVHGFVNGTQERESFVRGPNSAYFATNPANDKTVKKMPSKELSLLRAETVKDYLISQGIAADRITTKGEGGKVPIYPEGGSLGQLNDRVEVEFVKH